MAKSDTTAPSTDAAKAPATKSTESKLVEVKLDAEHTFDLLLNDVKVEFRKGVATVSAEVAKALRDAGFVK